MLLRHPKLLLNTAVRDKLLRELFEVDHLQRHRANCRQFHDARHGVANRVCPTASAGWARLATASYAFRSLKMARADAEQVSSEDAIKMYRGLRGSLTGVLAVFVRAYIALSDCPHNQNDHWDNQEKPKPHQLPPTSSVDVVQPSST